MVVPLGPYLGASPVHRRRPEPMAVCRGWKGALYGHVLTRFSPSFVQGVNEMVNRWMIGSVESVNGHVLVTKVKESARHRSKGPRRKYRPKEHGRP